MSLHLAACFGAQACVRVLLEHGADCECRDAACGMTPLLLAIGQRRVECMQLLLDRGAQIEAANIIGCTPLHAAALDGWLEGVQLLMARGANKEAVDARGNKPVDLASMGSHSAIVDMLCTPGAETSSPVSLLCRLVDDAVLESMLSGAGGPKLVAAAQGGDAAELRRLLAAGGDWFERDILGAAPLHAAALHGRPECVRLLLGWRGANVIDVNVRTVSMGRGETPLHFAAAGGDVECMRLLLDAGADVAMREEGGTTPLFYAVSDNRLACARLLLQHGASPLAEDRRGRTPLRNARTTEMQQLLQQAAAGADATG